MHLSEKGDYEAFGREAFEWFEALKEQPGSTPERAFSEYEDEAACWKRLVEGSTPSSVVSDVEYFAARHGPAVEGAACSERMRCCASLFIRQGHGV